MNGYICTLDTPMMWAHWLLKLVHDQTHFRAWHVDNSRWRWYKHEVWWCLKVFYFHTLLFLFKIINSITYFLYPIFHFLYYQFTYLYSSSIQNKIKTVNRLFFDNFFFFFLYWEDVPLWDKYSIELLVKIKSSINFFILM